MKKIFCSVLFLLCLANVQAQSLFLKAVKIEFEKTVYYRQLVKELEPQYYDRIKDRLPEAVLTYFNFTGDTTRAIYKPGKEAVNSNMDYYESFADKNVVFSDYRTGRTVAQKPVFEETFLIEDSLPQVKWKLTPDTRVIAGFECRKAVGIVRDSIAIFAFYTDEILVPGGPESITGLPGMILGMGVPRLHTTWFATKVEATGVDMNAVVPPAKGKKTNYKGLAESLGNAMKRWGNYGRKVMLHWVI